MTIDSFRVVLDMNNIGWCFLPYKKTNATSCPIPFAQPGDYAGIIKFANTPRATFDELRKNRPHLDKVKKALTQIHENYKFKNCTPNAGNLKAIGVW